MIAEKYYSQRARAYEAWDDNMLRAYLEKQGVIDVPKERTGLLGKIKDVCTSAFFSLLDCSLRRLRAPLSDYGVNDYIWSTWSDVKLRVYAVQEGVVDEVKAANMKRHEIEDLLLGKASSYTSWSDERIRGWLRSHNICVPASSNRNDLLKTMHANCSSRPSSRSRSPR